MGGEVERSIWMFFVERSRSDRWVLNCIYTCINKRCFCSCIYSNLCFVAANVHVRCDLFVWKVGYTYIS